MPGTRDSLLAWTMVDDRADSPATDASSCSIFVSNQDLMQVDDTGIAWGLGLAQRTCAQLKIGIR